MLFRLIIIEYWSIQNFYSFFNTLLIVGYENIMYFKFVIVFWL